LSDLASGPATPIADPELRSADTAGRLADNEDETALKLPLAAESKQQADLFPANQGQANGIVSSQSGETLPEFKRRRSENSKNKVPRTGNGQPASDADKAILYGKSRKKKQSCVIL